MRSISLDYTQNKTKSSLNITLLLILMTYLLIYENMKNIEADLGSTKTSVPLKVVFSFGTDVKNNLKPPKAKTWVLCDCLDPKLFWG